MSSRPEGWDWWSEAKLQVLADYLQAFTETLPSALSSLGQAR